jgi:Superinfection immunity protein
MSPLVVAGDHRLLNSQSVEQTHDIANVMEYGVLLHLLRSVASAIAMEVGRHRAEPALRERPKLMPPRIPALGKAVAEDDRAATDMSGLQPLRHNSDFTIAMSGAGHWGATLARSDSRAKDGMDNAAGLLAGFLVLALSLAIYFIPTLVAFERLRRNRGAIFVLNLFLGWTLVGWVAALVWAWMNPVTAMAPLETEGRAPCPHCREQIIVTARLCRFCGIELAADWSRPLVPHRRSW